MRTRIEFMTLAKEEFDIPLASFLLEEAYAAAGVFRQVFKHNVMLRLEALV